MVEEHRPVQDLDRRFKPPLKSGITSKHNNSTTPFGSNVREVNAGTSALNTFQRMRAPSPTSSYSCAIDISGVPPAIANDPCRKRAYIKARAQYARDQALDCVSEPPRIKSVEERKCPTQQVGCDGFGPTRKQSTFVKAEELQCYLEDRVGTAHVSELQTDFEVMPPLSVEETSMNGQAKDAMVSVNGLRATEKKLL